MKNLMILLILLALPCFAGAKTKTHIATSEGQECSECHADQERNWNESKHGLMGVKCVVCHGSPDNNFVAQPGPLRCRGCHAEKVEEAAKKKVKAEKSCFPCHEHCAGTVKADQRGPYHASGGN